MSARAGQNEGGNKTGRFLGTLRERWWVLLLAVALFGGIAFAVSLLLEPRYSSTAQVAYSQRDADAVSKALTDAGTAGLPHTLSSDTLVLQTSAFAERVSQVLGGSVEPDTVRSSIIISSASGVEVIYIKASAPQAGLAADIANACADEFVKTRQEEIRTLLQSAVDFVQGRIDTLTAAEQSAGTGLALQQNRYALTSLHSASVADYKVLDKAAVPAAPYFPNRWLNLLLGLAAGLVLGSLLILMISSTDPRIRDQATLERVMDLPVLGAMPATQAKQSAKRSAVGFGKGNEALLESMRTLRSNLKVLGFGDTKRSILITSTAPAEGKSALAVNLTLSMALAGDRVILVDADLRSPSVDRYLGIPNTSGLGDALSDPGASWSERIQAVDLAPFVDARLMSSRRPAETESGVSKFLCLTSGSLPTDPTEVLESPVMANLLAELQGYSDYVIVDAPPMLGASDSLILARAVDAVIFASTLGRQTAGEARQVRQLLARAQIEALGLVICGAKPHGREGDYYYQTGYQRRGGRQD